MPRVLLLLPATTYRAESFLEAARRLHLDVTVASEGVAPPTGPFPTEIDGQVAHFLREQGGAGHGEYGTVTGRPAAVGLLEVTCG